MLMPKRVKRRKQFRGSMKGKALRGNQITHGELSWSERGASASIAAEMSAIVGIKIWAVSDRPDAPDRSGLPDASAVVLSISPP